MATKMRRVALLGAFEIAPELNPPVKDGLILGSRRDCMGFVIETSRENIELIVAASDPARLAQVPMRLALSLTPLLNTLECSLIRVDLRPTTGFGGAPGSYVQAILVMRTPKGKLQRVAMAATEGLQVAIAAGLPIMADTSLLQLDVSQFLSEIDSYSQHVQEEAQEFKSFVDNVTASDFAKYLRKEDDEPGA